jgi:hypothetical protein
MPNLDLKPLRTVLLSILAAAAWVSVSVARDAPVRPPTPQELFVRVNRSVIVNLGYVERIERDPDSHLVFVLQDGRRFNVGRTFHAQVAQLLRL